MKFIIRYSNYILYNTSASLIMNRLKYDDCAHLFAINQSTAPVSFVLDPIRYYHQNRCRPGVGVVGGTAVSHVTENLVDLENELRGQTRPSTKCPKYHYFPRDDNTIVSTEYIKPVQHPVLHTDVRADLPECTPDFMNFSQVHPSPAD